MVEQQRKCSHTVKRSPAPLRKRFDEQVKLVVHMHSPWRVEVLVTVAACEGKWKV